MQQVSDPSTGPRPLSDAERKLLYRVKITLWFVSLLFILHALPAAIFPEAYPLTRWAMFSEANIGYHELKEDNLVRYSLRAVDVNGTSYEVIEHALYQGIPVSTAHINIARLAMSNASLTDKMLAEGKADVAARAQARQTIFDRLERKFGVEFVSYEIIRDFFEIDYSRYPYVDFNQPVHTEIAALVTRAEEEAASNG